MEDEILSYEDQYAEYMNMKAIEHLWYAGANPYVNGHLFDELYQLEWFKDGIIDNRNLLDESAAKNVRDIIERYKYIEDKDSTKRKEIINEIIIALNSPYDKEKNYEFYRGELAKRYNNKIFLNITDAAVERNKQMVNESIASDYVLLSMLCEFKDEEFNKVMDELEFDNFHILSLNAIIEEFPLIITNSMFLPRVKIILNRKKHKKENKKLIKRINKIIDEFNKGV